jgi:hypothetical protein
MSKLPDDLLAKWKDQRARGVRIGSHETVFHFGRGMWVRNTLRDQLPDDELPMGNGTTITTGFPLRSSTKHPESLIGVRTCMRKTALALCALPSVGRHGRRLQPRWGVFALRKRAERIGWVHAKDADEAIKRGMSHRRARQEARERPARGMKKPRWLGGASIAWCARADYAERSPAAFLGESCLPRSLSVASRVSSAIICHSCSPASMSSFT